MPFSNTNKWRLKLSSSWTHNRSNQGPDQLEMKPSERMYSDEIMQQGVKDQDVILGYDWVLSPCAGAVPGSSHDDVICGKVFLSDTTCLLLSGATVTRAALKVWEWAPVTRRQGRYLFFLEEIQYLLLLLGGSELRPELFEAQSTCPPERLWAQSRLSGGPESGRLYNMISYC